MNEFDGNADLLLLDSQIGEVETRLCALRDEIIAMADDGDDESGAWSELLSSASRAVRCMQLFRMKIHEGMAGDALGPGGPDGSGPGACR